MVTTTMASAGRKHCHFRWSLIDNPCRESVASPGLDVGFIEDAVKRTQERVIPTGILLPQSLIVRLTEGEFFTLGFLFHSSIKC